MLPLFAGLLLAGCASRVIPPAPTPAPQPVVRPIVTQPVTTQLPRPVAQRAPLPSVSAITGRAHRIAAEAGLRPGPTVADLALAPAVAARALATFRISCRSVTRRTDTSGLTRP